MTVVPTSVIQLKLRHSNKGRNLRVGDDIAFDLGQITNRIIINYAKKHTPEMHYPKHAPKSILKYMLERHHQNQKPWYYPKCQRTYVEIITVK